MCKYAILSIQFIAFFNKHKNNFLILNNLIIIFFVTLMVLPTAVFADLDNAHSIATDYMFSRSQNNETKDTTESIPIIFSAADDDSLLVGISVQALAQNITYTEAQVQEALGVDVPIKIKYMTIMYDDDNWTPVADQESANISTKTNCDDYVDSESCDDAAQPRTSVLTAAVNVFLDMLKSVVSYFN